MIRLFAHHTAEHTLQMNMTNMVIIGSAVLLVCALVFYAGGKSKD